MKRILYVFVLLAALVAASCQENLVQFSVTPTTLEFGGDAQSLAVSVTAGDTWAVKITEGSSWITSSKTYGQSSMEVTVSVTANSPSPRSERWFSAALVSQ